MRSWPIVPTNRWKIQVEMSAGTRQSVDKNAEACLSSAKPCRALFMRVWFVAGESGVRSVAVEDESSSVLVEVELFLKFSVSGHVIVRRAEMMINTVPPRAGILKRGQHNQHKHRRTSLSKKRPTMDCNSSTRQLGVA